MGQSEIYSYLKKKSNKWFSSIDLVKITGSNISSVNRSLSVLYRTNFLYRKLNENKEKTKAFYLYKIKRCCL
jgi:predicted transcriptional regulator